MARCRAVDGSESMYEARHRFTRQMAGACAGCIAFLLAALLPIPWPIAILDVVVFGFFLIYGMWRSLGHRVAFRVDVSGVTLGGAPPFYRRSMAFIPWGDVKFLQVYLLPVGRQEIPYIRVSRRHGCPPLPSGFGYGYFNQHLMGEDFTAHRQVQSWELDVTQLRAVLSKVAPHVQLRGSLPTHVVSQSSVHDFLSDLRSNEGFRFCWRYFVPIFAACALTISGLDLGPAWKAHVGDGHPGTWTATRVWCGKDDCTWRGDFTSNDGLVRRRDVELDGWKSVGATIGDQAPAVDTGDSPRVYSPDGGSRWWEFSALAAGSALLLGLWVWTVPINLIRRRSASISNSTREGHTEGS